MIEELRNSRICVIWPLVESKCLEKWYRQQQEYNLVRILILLGNSSQLKSTGASTSPMPGVVSVFTLTTSIIANACHGAIRFTEEKKSGAVSDEGSEIILDFCFAKPEIPVAEGGITTLLDRVGDITRGLSVTGPVKIKLPKNISLADLYGLARPEDRPGEYWLEHRAGWLANILVTIAPELVIRERAMNKAEERVRTNLKKQVEIRPDLEAVWKNRLKSLLAICAPNPQ